MKSLRCEGSRSEKEKNKSGSLMSFVTDKNLFQGRVREKKEYIAMEEVDKIFGN